MALKSVRMQEKGLPAVEFNPFRAPSLEQTLRAVEVRKYQDYATGSDLLLRLQFSELRVQLPV